MAYYVRDLIAPQPVTLSAASTLVDAAMAMREFDVGAVVVLANNQLYGIATDRDIVIRAIANGSYPATTMIGEVCSRDVATIAPSATVEEVLHHMRDKATCYVAVVENGQPIGVVSISDITSQKLLASPPTKRSATPPNR